MALRPKPPSDIQADIGDSDRVVHARPDQLAVEVNDAVASYGADSVLKGASLAINTGEVISLLGPSGCGKTTLLRSIAGLTRLDSGTVKLGDKMVSGPGIHMPPELRQVGMVFQDGALFPHLTVLQNIEFGLRRHPEATTRACEVLELTSMSEYADRLPGTLSGGQQQRIALARALAPKPSVLLLDEPFSALDAGLRVQLRRDVREILREVDITSIVVTHDQDEAFSLGDRVAVMNKGRVGQVGTPNELYQTPVSPWVARFVGEANEFVGQVTDHRVTTIIGDVPFVCASDAAMGATEVRVAVRPEQLAVAPGGAGTIESVEYFGHDARYEVAIADQRVGVRVHSAEFAIGDRVDVTFVGGTVPGWGTTE